MRAGFKKFRAIVRLRKHHVTRRTEQTANLPRDMIVVYVPCAFAARRIRFTDSAATFLMSHHLIKRRER